MMAALIAAVGLIAPSAAWAQMTFQPMPTPPDLRRSDTTPEVMLPDRDTPQSIEYYAHTLAFASCAANQNPALVTKALAAAPATSAADQRLTLLRTQLGSCNAQSAVTVLELVRGALSEARYKALVAGPIDPRQIAATSSDSGAFLDAEVKWNQRRLANDRAMIDATNCLVAVEPALAHRALTTRHGSREEAAAFDDLFEKAPTCAGKKRPKNLSLAFLRAFTADSMYRLAMSQWRTKFLPWTGRGSS